MAAAQIRSWGWKWVGGSGNRVAEIQESIAVLEQLDREHSADPSVITILGDGYLRLGQFGPVTQKTENLQKGRRILEAGLERHPDNARIRDRLADLYGTLSSLLPPAEGEILLQEVITLCQPLTYENRGIAAWAMAILAERHASRNELTAAIDLAQRGIETRSQAVEAVPTNSIHRIALAGDLVTCARLLVRDGRIEEAASLFREAVRHSNQTMRENPGVLHYRDSHTGIRQAFSSFINEHGQPGDREALLAEHNQRLAAGYIVRSLDYVDLKDDVLRMADVHTALKLDPDNLDAINAAYVDQLQRGEVDDAKSLARRAVAVPQDRVENWTLRGEQFQLLGEFMQAILAFDKATEDEPPQWHIVKRRGVANFFVGRYDEALSDMTYALSGKPDDISTLLWIDPSLVAACPSEAFRNGMLRLADEAVEVNQGAADHRVVRGVLRASMGRRGDAQVDFDAVVASPSATAYSLYVVALMRLSNNDRDAYRAACETLSERFHESQDSDALYWAVWTCALTPGAVEDYDAVTALARRALAQQATEQKHVLGLGAVLFRAGEFEEAKQHLSACAEALNTSATCPAYVWYFLAMTNHRLGHHDEARKWLDKASEFTARILIESKAGRYRLFWNRRATLELLDAEAKALLVTDSETSPPAE